ncbi:GNAT family N-acetyltransferase [Nocardiopsis changdeensis]|uniref:GNAT family N-acetyltransferase n=1 Tax=Nocardiopsis changdeensis TaxID=2831969 RepID=A0ABX8BPL3_9ACTN|nr:MULTISPECIES: GNAT family protein [Nocardiopsis]QUX24184.1 GNAT family N-acetyltransferase [Nocardiopsis changdeensis]QYX34578.1 GNAT family N-acetyltransferase [Nocardiopsis sp. MT53]
MTALRPPRPVLPSVVLETERLRLRAFIEDDIDDVYASCSDPGLQAWLPLPRPDAPYTRADAEQWCREIAPGMRTGGEGQQWAVTLRDGGRLVGAVGLVRVMWQAMNSEIGYWAAPGERGRGHITEAVVAVSRWALDQGFQRLEIKAAPRNTASRRVAEKAGFTLEGVERGAMPLHGGRRTDLAVYGLLPADLRDRPPAH